MNEQGPLHEMNPTGRFTDRAGDYVKYRPTYPAGAIDAVFDGLGDVARLVVADIGAGTGISSRLLAERGAQVIAVEPNAAMRGASERHPRVEWREGTGEATGLATASVDVVVCAQAFHWMRQEEALREFSRVLRPRGRLALMWNERDRGDAVMRGYREAILTVGGEHPAELRPFDPGVVGRSGVFGEARLVECANEQRLDEAGLIGRAMSASYAPNGGEGRERLVELLRALHRAHRGADGLVTLKYVTRVWVAERR